MKYLFLAVHGFLRDQVRTSCHVEQKCVRNERKPALVAQKTGEITSVIKIGSSFNVKFKEMLLR